MRDFFFRLAAARVPMRAFFITAIATLAASGQAWAHAHVDHQSPLAGEVVSSPHEVSITYDASLEPAFSSLVVRDAAGKPVSSAKVEIAVAAPNVMRVALPPLSAGEYEVSWVAVGRGDGHRTQGHYKFRVK